MTFRLTLLALLAGSWSCTHAQSTAKPEDTEVWAPEPKVVAPGPPGGGAAPADALLLFDGKNLNEWVSTDNRNAPAAWTVAGGVFTVNKASGNIETKRRFGSYQLHLEWRIPAGISGTGQARGNSGVFLASTGAGDLGYELQILDSYQNKTYVNGMAGSIYKQYAPLANPARPPGEWQTYDIAWTAPTFTAAGALATPARVTVFFNGVLVQNNVALLGPTLYIGAPSYQAHGPTSIKLQAHGDKSEPISFRNIWVRELPAAAK
ncbi:3-keto-disaccharide hydrolase [Hymenobacter weizhouensis]|uniref:3-keto-disaccharide hydrolase n=1 Tax=Hymenobacter sp. YIM 151500-1 TaxID=2987689 RepID=UPI0022271D1C|nr:DUF1080 domain-containing protein [Hymenobacter sp. YIM 151500-1]UYZ61664.1 DUF1080 domain-containing protein [Hymenobacter sp. YIM 151500-1]